MWRILRRRQRAKKFDELFLRTDLLVNPNISTSLAELFSCDDSLPTILAEQPLQVQSPVRPQFDLMQLHGLDEGLGDLEVPLVGELEAAVATG